METLCKLTPSHIPYNSGLQAFQQQCSQEQSQHQDRLALCCPHCLLLPCRPPTALRHLVDVLAALVASSNPTATTAQQQLVEAPLTWTCTSHESTTHPLVHGIDRSGYPGAVLTVRPPPPEEEWLGRLAAPDPLLDDPLMYSDLPASAPTPSLGAPSSVPQTTKGPARLLPGGATDGHGAHEQQQAGALISAGHGSSTCNSVPPPAAEGGRQRGAGGDVSLWVSPHRPRGYR
jgi:hypothetical protein